GSWRVLCIIIESCYIHTDPSCHSSTVGTDLLHYSCIITTGELACAVYYNRVVLIQTDPSCHMSTVGTDLLHYSCIITTGELACAVYYNRVVLHPHRSVLSYEHCWDRPVALFMYHYNRGAGVCCVLYSCRVTSTQIRLVIVALLGPICCTIHVSLQQGSWRVLCTIIESCYIHTDPSCHNSTVGTDLLHYSCIITTGEKASAVYYNRVVLHPHRSVLS
ncbi:hypothetical protein J6590_100255, partial [Homalodisca vitripennis]